MSQVRVGLSMDKLTVTHSHCGQPPPLPRANFDLSKGRRWRWNRERTRGLLYDGRLGAISTSVDTRSLPSVCILYQRIGINGPKFFFRISHPLVLHSGLDVGRTGRPLVSNVPVCLKRRRLHGPRPLTLQYNVLKWYRSNPLVVITVTLFNAGPRSRCRTSPLPPLLLSPLFPSCSIQAHVSARPEIIQEKTRVGFLLLGHIGSLSSARQWLGCACPARGAPLPALDQENPNQVLSLLKCLCLGGARTGDPRRTHIGIRAPEVSALPTAPRQGQAALTTKRPVFGQTKPRSGAEQVTHTTGPAGGSAG
ncbi:hypothetical protein LY76DRAFT_325655 [Colletotrichum caudatum]|nr:hypothetical protein LY76DRAFT_325655 [Colletotrichum caudatum]